MFEPKEGVLTFRAEGNDTPGSPWFSRKVHWPGNLSKCVANASGVTLGRGFDMGARTKGEIIHKLLLAGIPRKQAEKFAEGAKLTHCKAADFVRKQGEKLGEITHHQQVRLFEITYSDYVADARSFYIKHKRPNAISWERMDRKLREVFVDMKYQGVMYKNNIQFFENNNINDVINLIQTKSYLYGYEKGRNRIGFLKGN